MTSPPLTEKRGVARVATPPGKHGKYLTFSLGREEYGLEILRVREIVGHMHVTPVPGTPPYVTGVINLRGRVIPVMDLRARFQMEPAEVTRHTCIIVVDSSRDGRSLGMGLVVDRVSDVVEIADGQIEEPPALGLSVSTDYVRGLGKSGGSDSVKILLDTERVLAAGHDPR